MSIRVRVFAFLALLCLLLAGLLLLPDPDTRRAVFSRLVQASKLLAALGCLAAALAFERGDYLRRAWGLQALALIFLARDVVPGVIVPGAVVLGVRSEVLDHVCVIAGNVTGVLSTWLMAQAWQVAGIELPGSPLRRRAIGGFALLLALAVTGVPLLRSVHAWLEGAPVPILVLVTSSIGDAAGIVLIAPVFWTVLAMRGGLLGWPWGLFAASMGCWLVYDGLDIVTHLTTPALRGVLDAILDAVRVLACALMGLGGLTQRRVVRSIRQEPALLPGEA
jgi:hypothetical protein